MEPDETLAEPGGTPAESGRSGEPRGANLRMVALASAVALAVVLPLAAATAGPVGLPGPESARGEHPGKHPGAGDGLRGESAGLGGPGKNFGKDLGRGLGPDLGEDLGEGLGVGGRPGPGAGRDAARGGRGTDGGWPAASPPLTGPAGPAVSASARCGPELTSPEGVEAQTCVLEQGNETWARTYYRNATGAPLRAVLTLMGPDGRTVQVHCRTTASDDPDGCETPRARTVGAGSGQAAGSGRAAGGGNAAGAGAGDAAGGELGGDPYEAVAEIASADGKLLLRSGSNSAEDRGD
ncbi:hypothetical protein [Streptomyces rectiverticillatus]|uniref:hypothetical protein n=1 Tax=Streptomyces rectiverticillatus TaxID=173860 RepID=UPI0031B6178D